MTSPKPTTERSASYKQKMLKAGYIRVSTWIKQENEQKFREMAGKLK